MKLTDYSFRCTYCNEIVLKPITRADLDLALDEILIVGKMYRFLACYCGFGRYVICEKSDWSIEDMEEHLLGHMEH